MTDPIGTAQERELIERLRSLLSEATARPWVAFDEGNVLALMKGHRPRAYSTAKGRKWQEIIAWTGFDAADVPKHYRRANLHLIVAAINGLPAILDAFAEVGRLEERVAELWEAIFRVKDRCWEADDANWQHDILSIVVPLTDAKIDEVRAALSLQRRV